MDIFKISALCLVAAFLSLIFLEQKKEYAMVISVAAGSLVFLSVARSILSPLFNLFGELSAGAWYKYILVALKAVAIGYVTELTAGTCRDFGFSAVAAKAELAGKAAVFLICTPLISDLFAVITEIL